MQKSAICQVILVLAAVGASYCVCSDIVFVALIKPHLVSSQSYPSLSLLNHVGTTCFLWCHILWSWSIYYKFGFKHPPKFPLLRTPLLQFSLVLQQVASFCHFCGLFQASSNFIPVLLPFHHEEHLDPLCNSLPSIFCQTEVLFCCFLLAITHYFSLVSC